MHYYSEWVFSNPLGRTIFDEPLFNDHRTARTRVDDFFDILYEQFISKGIGVSVGEWGLLAYDHTFGTDALQRGEELKYYEYVQHRARDFRGVSLSFWDNGSGIDRRSADYQWKIPRVGAMLGSNARSSYSTGLDTIYFKNAASADIRIPLTLNGNQFVGIEGLTRGTDYTYESGVVTLRQAYVNSKFNAMDSDKFGAFDVLVMQFSRGLDWYMFLVKNDAVGVYASTGTKSLMNIPIDFKGNRVHRVQAFRGTAPDTLVDGQGNRVGGNHTSWWSYLEYGYNSTYLVDYSTGTFILRPGFFAGGVNDGLNTLVIEFYDGSRLDIPLTVSGNNVTSPANTSGTPPTPPSCITCNADPCLCPPDIPLTPCEKCNEILCKCPPVVQPPCSECNKTPCECITVPPNTDEPGNTNQPPNNTNEPPNNTNEPPNNTNQPPNNTNEPNNTTEPKPNNPDVPEDGYELGDVNNNGEIDIGDALEILKYLAGLESLINDDIKAFNAALIMGEDEPTIGDVLEILKYLADLPCMLND